MVKFWNFFAKKINQLHLSLWLGLGVRFKEYGTGKELFKEKLLFITRGKNKKFLYSTFNIKINHKNK